ILPEDMSRFPVSAPVPFPSLPTGWSAVFFCILLPVSPLPAFVSFLLSGLLLPATEKIRTSHLFLHSPEPLHKSLRSVPASPFASLQIPAFFPDPDSCGHSP